MNIQHYYQRGLTLLELLVATTLGLVIVTGTIQIYLGTSQTYRIQESLSRIQENGRYTMEVLNREIRMAGYSGCRLSPSQSFANVLNNPANNWWSDFETMRGFQEASIQGFSGGDTFPAQSDGINSAQRVAGTEALIVIGGGNRSYPITSHNPGNSRFTLTSLQDLQVDDIFLVCDSDQVSVGQVTETSAGNNTFDHADTTGHSPGNCTNFLGTPDLAAIAAAGDDPNAIDICTDAVAYAFGSNAVLTRLTPLAYYIGRSTATDSGGTPLSTSLFRIRAPGNPQELIEHVEDMLILYGVDTSTPPNGQINDYVEVNDVTDWRNVLSVRFNVLLASPPGTRVINEPQTVMFPAEGFVGGNRVSGVAVTNNDGRLRQAFSATIGIRNRLP